MDKPYEVRVTPDVPYAVVGVGYRAGQGPSGYRNLLLDIYQPVGLDGVEKPALILACGGAYSRGDRKNDEGPAGAARNTPTSAYCMELARRGFVCFSVDYRLMQEDPDPGFTPTLDPAEIINADRVNFVRAQLGFAPCTPDMMRWAIEAATDDVFAAVTYMLARAHELEIDTRRIALGGFSAGAIAALNAAFAQRAPVAAVVALSGRMSVSSAKKHMRADSPPILMVVGENDLPAQIKSADELEAYMKQAGHPHLMVRPAGASHFYPSSTQCVVDGKAMDVESLVAGFLFDKLGLGPASGSGAARTRPAFAAV